MTDKQFTTKRESLKKTCLYGLKHFCDGTPNLSEDATAKKRLPCPMYLDCKHKANRLIKRAGEM